MSGRRWLGGVWLMVLVGFALPLRQAAAQAPPAPPPPPPVGLAKSPWAKWQGGAANLGLSTGQGNNPGLLRWQFDPFTIDTTRNYQVACTVIGPDGTVYVVANEDSYDEGEIFALQPTRGVTPKLLWRIRLDEPIYGTPAVAADGTLIVGTRYYDRGGLYALQPTGTGSAKVLWRLAGDCLSSPAIGPDGTIYVARHQKDRWGRWVYNQTLCAVWNDAATAQAGILWMYDYPGSWLSDGWWGWDYYSWANVPAPTVGDDGLVYFSDGDAVYALQDSQGPVPLLLWRYVSGGYDPGPPSLGRNGNVYSCLYNGWVALRDNGTTVPTVVYKQPQSYVKDVVHVGADGTLYTVDTRNVKAWTETATGPPTLKWTCTVTTYLLGLAVAADNMVYAIDDYVGLVAIKDGKRLWSTDTSIGVRNLHAPAIDKDGTVYCANPGTNYYTDKFVAVGTAYLQGPSITTSPDASTPANTATDVRFIVDDPDVGGKPVRICLYASHGTLKLATTFGCRFLSGHTDGGQSIIFQSTIKLANLALAKVTYTPRTDYLGPALVACTANDLANAGSTVALHGANSVRLLVTGSGYSINAWGESGDGQCSPPAAAVTQDQVAGGGLHTLAKSVNGKVTAFGNNWYGQCNLPANLLAYTIGAGAFHSLAVQTDGHVVAAGYNGYGQTTVPDAATDCTQVAAGLWHSVALTRDGHVLAWGYNGSGQCTVPDTAYPAVAVACGTNYSAALHDDGTVVCWGSNTYGQAAPPPLTDVVSLACGTSHMVALRSNGQVVCWGADYSGQSEVPASLSSAVEVAAGNEHSLALRADGTVLGWGATAVRALVVPSTLTGQISISAGGGHSLSLGPRPLGTVSTSERPAPPTTLPSKPLVALLRPPSVILSESPAPATVALLVSPVSPQAVGTVVQLTAVGAPAGSEYQFVVSVYSPQTRRFEPRVIREFDPRNTCDWTPAAAGDYRLAVNTRQAGASATYQATTGLRFSVKPSADR